MLNHVRLNNFDDVDKLWTLKQYKQNQNWKKKKEKESLQVHGFEKDMFKTIA